MKILQKMLLEYFPIINKNLIKSKISEEKYKNYH